MSSAILRNQKALGEGIKAKYTKFSQAAAERKNKSYAMEKIESLEKDWKIFQENNVLLQEATDLDGSHEYFDSNYYDIIKEVYQSYGSELRSLIQTLDLLSKQQYTGTIPKEKTLEMPKNPIDEDGAIADEAILDILEPNGNEQQTKYPILLDNLFKAASTQNLNNISLTTSEKRNRLETGPSKAAQNMIKSLEDLMKVWTGNKRNERFSTSEIQVLLGIMIRKWDTIQSLQDELITQKSYDIQPYLDLEKEMVPILVEYHDSNKIPEQTGKQIVTQSSAKMPKLSIPVFSGDYVKWKSFKQLFLKMIGNKAELDGCEKLAYLQGQLEGEPERLIATLPLIDSSYNIAWNILNERFDNTHVIVTKLIHKLLTGVQMKKYSIESMKATMDRIRECVDTLTTVHFEMNDSINYILYYLVESQLDRPTLSLYENTLTPSDKPRKYDHLMRFLKQRIQNLSAKDETPPKHQKPQTKKYNNGYKKEKITGYSTSLVVASAKPAKANSPRATKCNSCNENHKITQCPVFTAMSPDEKYKKIREWKRCTNCLQEGHTVKDCKSHSCKSCNKKHNTLLHNDNRIQKSSKQNTAATLFGSAIKNEGFKHVFLATAIINVNDKNGNPVRARAVLDSGSQLNLITEKLHRKLGLNHQDASMKVSGIGTTLTESKKRTNVKITSKISGYETHLELFVIKQITTCQPANKINIKDWKIPSNISLADPQFNIPAPVDIVIGGELFFKLISMGIISVGETLPELQNTVFGWVVTGKVEGKERNEAFVGISTEQSLEHQVNQFWRIEEKNQDPAPMTKLEQSCEKFFEDTTTRNTINGKFIVKLQFTKEPSVLGQSEHMAVRRFLYLEKRFERNPDLKRDYTNFMREYEELGHMEIINKHTIGKENYFIPHHGVRNPGSSTTKFRVVFDASAKTTSNIALNEILANGPMLQQDLFSIIARFRVHAFVFSADITKMYRQVEIDQEHQKWQIIVWRENPESTLKYYKLKTLTYGTTCASYLAIKALQTLADQHGEKYPNAAVIAKRDFNVDDVMTGSNNLQEAIILQQELIQLCKKGNFQLHKWCSNHPALLDKIPKTKQEISLDFNAEKTETKALGMKWIPKSDLFMLSYNPKEHKQITKRTVLSETAQLFDPLGIVNPVIVLAKIFLQELWQSKMDWDVPLPMELRTKWSEFRKELIKLNNVKLPRHIVIKDPVDIQLHAFSDASTRAYGGVFYLRSTNIKGEVQVSIICSKSRVAPTNTITLPRLELCAAVTTVEIATKLNKILGIKISSTTYWTDSELVLSWIHADESYKTFVANRVAYITRHTDAQDWKYINTKENPADLVSRGIFPEKLIKSELWWNGPNFLKMNKCEWPEIKPAFVRDPTEERSIKTVLTTYEKDEHFIDRINHRNSIRVLQRVVAYMLRFNHHSLAKNAMLRSETANLTVEELKAAMVKIIKHVQNTCFEDEIELVREGKGNKTKFSNFVPIIDADGVLRVGGRLQASKIPFEQKHPALLPKNHIITKLIIERIHLENMHVGPQALLSIVRQKYWPENGKRLAQATVRKCVLCSRSKPMLMEQIMGNLPADRINVARPFSSVGLDFCGPMTIHHKIRGKRTRKAYICVFTCFVTKAVHLEAANDLTTQGFVNCLKRFIARRAAPKRITCDNATNFRGTYNQLTELTDLMNDEQHQQQVIRYCQDHEIEWKFAPPRSPHFNGLAEAAVKSAKLHIKKVTHSMELTYDELATLLSEIEAILNSRPLTPMSNNPNDLQPLTPGHFLVGKALTCMSDADIPYSSKTKMWHKMVGLKNEFWKRWSKEYIAELQGRNKWTTERENIKVGNLVIIHDDDVPPLKWKMGRVTNIIQDDNGKVRVVDLHTSTTNMDKAKNHKTGKINIDKIKTSTKILRRAIHRICPLPIETETSEKTQQITNDQPIVKQPQQVPKMQLIRKINNVEPLTSPKKIVKPIPSAIRRKLNPEVQEFQPVARRTRSKGLNMSSNLFLMALALMAIISGAFGIQCNYTSFSHNPGLYFEENGKMSLSNDKWNIISFMKLEPFCAQVGQIEQIFTRLEKLCSQMDPSEYCNLTIKQLKQKAKAAIEYNELILGFSHHSLIRKRREWSDSFSSLSLTEIVKNTTKIINQGMEIAQNNKEMLLKKASLLSKFCQDILKQSWRYRSNNPMDNLINKEQHDEWSSSNKQKIILRTKRGWANFVGSGLKVIGGVMDNDDAEKIENQINQLNSSYQNAMHLINQQTSMQDITENIIKKEQIAISSQLARFETELNKINQGNQSSKFDIFNIMALQTLMMIISHKETQNAILDLMSQIHHGKIPTTLLTPEQLKEHLELISSKINKDIMVPGDPNPQDLVKIYSILNAKIKITAKTIIIQTTLPLIHRDYFDMFHIIPLPFKFSKSSMHMIETSQQYIAVNKLLDRYYMLSHAEKAECQAFSEELIICEQKHILHTTQNSLSNCEMAIFTHPSKGISPKCTLKEFLPTQIWSKLLTPNHFLFTVPEQVTFNIICEKGSTICTASDSGIITLPQHCIIQTNNMEIKAENVYQSELPTIFVPEINITDLLNESISVPNRTTLKNEFQVDPLLEDLENAIRKQKDDSEQVTPTFSWHDVHHYTAVYVIMAFIFIGSCGIIWIVKKQNIQIFIPGKKSGEANQTNIQPIASPRSGHMSNDNTSFP